MLHFYFYKGLLRAAHMKKQVENMNHFLFLFQEKIISLFFLTLAKLVRHISNTSVFDLFINIPYVYIEALSQNLKSNLLSLLVNILSVLERQAQDKWCYLLGSYERTGMFPSSSQEDWVIQAQIAVVCSESELSAGLIFFLSWKKYLGMWSTKAGLGSSCLEW